MTRRDRLRAITIILGTVTAVPALAQGRWLPVTTGINITFLEALQNLISFLAVSIGAVSVAAFTYGAFRLVLSRGQNVDRAKTIMLNALLGLSVVLGSYGILRTLLWILL